MMYMMCAWAGTGCIVSSVKVGSGREPIVLGKPHPPIFQVIQNR